MIKYSRIKRVHFTGIGGAGMSGIAEVLHNMGFSVSGSDIAENTAVKRLLKMGLSVFIGHEAGNVTDAETLVYSSAISPENVEVREAKRRKIPVISRAEMLGELMRLKFSLAVAGTHGKTTTTSMIATILHFAGKDPTYVVGGRLKIEESGAKLGHSDYLIAEADESDGSFLQLFPSIAVITNIEDDHLDHYGTMDHLLRAFISFGDKVPFYGSVVINGDCPHCREILTKMNKSVRTFGFGASVNIRGHILEESVFSSTFELFLGDDSQGSFTLNVGGRHNVMNALAAIAVCLEIGLNTEQIRSGLKKFHLPERRFQVLYRSEDYLIVDDYAHHPTEVKATLKTLASGDFKRIIAVFQPHRYSRLERLMDGFAGSFVHVDQLVVASLYAANQAPVSGVDGKALAGRIEREGGAEVHYFPDFKGISRYLTAQIRPGDAVIFLSAGDLTRLAHEFAEGMEGKQR